MAIIIDAAWLKKQGVKVSHEETKKLVEQVNSEWEWRVGSLLADQFSDEQIADFEHIDDEDERLAWLETAYPHYPKIVEEQASALAQEITKAQDKIKLIKSWDR